MTPTFNVLKNVSDFAPGAFENTSVENGCIQLGHLGKGYLETGSYTAPSRTGGPFNRLIPSWNADTPLGTTVEVQVRVARKGHWSRWFSFGVWSPYIDRASPEPAEDEVARCDAEILSMTDMDRPADTYQMRILLKTEDPKVTPMVRLLATSVDSVDTRREKQTALGRELEVPTYSCLVRDPSLDERMAGACSVTMLLNRWGEDLLPEEVARAVYDSGAGRYANLSFLSAAAGMYGFESFGGFGDVEALRREIWYGNAVAAKVRYRAPSLGGHPDTEEDALPVLEGASVDSLGHLVVVRGFVQRGGEEYIIVNDPMAPADGEVRREWTLAQFKEIFLGIFLMLHKVSGAGLAKPQRRLATLTLDEGQIQLRHKDRQLIPGDLRRCTTCYTLSDRESTAYPSAAKKKFYYPHPDSEGTLRFDTAASLGKKMTLYYIGPYGDLYVAEKFLRKPPPEPVPEAIAKELQPAKEEEA